MIRSWQIPGGTILADHTFAALVLGPERFPLRTAAELEVARSRLFHGVPGASRAEAVNHLIDAYEHHINAAVSDMIDKATRQRVA